MRGNLFFQRSIHFFRVLGRTASLWVVVGSTIDADKEIALALQRGESRIRRAAGQRPKISRQTKSFPVSTTPATAKIKGRTHPLSPTSLRIRLQRDKSPAPKLFASRRATGFYG